MSVKKRHASKQAQAAQQKSPPGGFCSSINTNIPKIETHQSQKIK
ncbi:hypothetical protein [Polynucleobacter sp. KF022]|nr:hypothetical protein [Polynucleobacter sp. KF022]